MTTFRRCADAALTGTLILLLMAFIAWLTVPRILGVTPQRVLTGSMEPTLPVGSVAFIGRVAPTDVRVGDIITFHEPVESAQGALITHRVAEIVADSRGNPAFRTKGDANDIADPWVVPSSLLVGRERFDAPYAGELTDFVHSPLGFLLVIGLPAAYLASGEVRNVVRVVKEHRGARARRALES